MWQKVYLVPFLLFSFFTISLRVLAQNVSEYDRYPADTAASADLCQLARPMIIKANDFYNSVQFRTALAGIQEAIAKNQLREYTVSFGQDSIGNVIVSSVLEGNHSNSRLPLVRNGFADFHSHPKNTPPSSGDVYGLLMKNKKSGEYTMRYVVTNQGTIFVLAVIDTVAARTFLERYPPQQMPGYSPLFPDALLDEYRELLYRYKLPEEFVMAFMLEKYAAGLVLLKQQLNGAFELLRTRSVNESSTVSFDNYTCM